MKMKVALIFPDNWFMKLAESLQKLGVTVFKNKCNAEVDFIIGGSISQMTNIWAWHKLYPNIPMANYHWDMYSWQIERPRDHTHIYEYGLYKELLKMSRIVWVPSECTRKRTLEYFGIDSEVLHTYVPVFDYEITRGDYIYQPLRKQPDRDWGLLESVCEEIGIKCVTHAEPYEEYQKVLAGCKAVVSPFYEASTGSLSLVEAAHLGKPCLVSDSPYNGGNEYLSGVPTFKSGDREDLKQKLLDIDSLTYTPIFMDFSIEAMAKKICKSISQHLGK